MTILIIAEPQGQQLAATNWSVLAAAETLKADIDLLIMGSQCGPLLDEAQLMPGLRQILVADHPDYAHQLAENSAALIATIGHQYDYILCASSTFGKNLLPRVAALLDKAMLSDVIRIIAADTFVRPIYAGNLLATVKTQESIKLMTIRTTAFAAKERLKTASGQPMISLTTVIPNTTTQFEGASLTESTRPELSTAKIIVSGGRGLKSKDKFHLIEALADCLGAAIGATRAAVDAGFAPNDYQIGQTGKIVAPDLYFAIGISGAIQHLAGMKDSKVIVAINNDPEAPILQEADYVLVGDLFKLVPELTEALTTTKICSG